MRIEGRTFLVSGGASGLGGATARMLASAGANVLILDVNAELGEHLAGELSPRARFVRTDVSREEDVARAVSLARGSFGGPPGGGNAAGTAGAGEGLRHTGRPPA